MLQDRGVALASHMPKHAVCLMSFSTCSTAHLLVLVTTQTKHDLHTVFASQVQEKVKMGLVPMNKYIITKQLTKRPEDYPDARNQAHVQVALRRRAAGKRDGVMQVCLLEL